jgi:drug/metabolite transporter (DMT)-like permease
VGCFDRTIVGAVHSLRADGLSARPPGLAQGNEKERATAYLLLGLSALSWSGNAIAARLAVGEVSPIALITFRWSVVAILVLVIWQRQIFEALPVLRRHWLFIAALGTIGLTGFNTLFYIAAYHTTAAHLSILQGCIPVFVLIGAAMAYRMPARPRQVAGIAITIVGVLIVAVNGDVESLRSISCNRGDVMMVIGCMCYAIYTIALHVRPSVPAIVFFAGVSMSAFLSSLPLLAVEVATNSFQWPTTKGWAILIVVAIFPTFLAQIWFMRGVQLIGPTRAGLFSNLVPILGPLLAVGLLGESFALNQAVALVLVIGGIFIAEPRRRITGIPSG